MLSSMANASTHRLTFDGQRVTKTYRDWDRGEPRREWDALTLIHRHRPGLAPVPLHHLLAAEPPSIVMSRVPGVSLADIGRLAPRQYAGIAMALERLHTAVPATLLPDVPLRRSHAAEAVTEVRTWMAEAHDVGDDALTRSALAEAGRWLASKDADSLSSGEGTPVFTHGDGNLSNFVWSDEAGTAHIVDFEDAGRSDRAYELADLTEHISTWVDGSLDTASFLQRVDIDGHERERFRQSRRLFATFWLLMLLPDGRAHSRNPAGTLQRQVQRLFEAL